MVAVNLHNRTSAVLQPFDGAQDFRRSVIALIPQLRAFARGLSGQRDEAEAKKAEVAGLKYRQTELERQRDEAEAAMRDLLSGLPNIPAEDVPVGADESAADVSPQASRAKMPNVIVGHARTACLMRSMVPATVAMLATPRQHSR